MIPKATLRQVELHLPRASVFFGEGRSNLQLLHLVKILNIFKMRNVLIFAPL